MEGDNKGKNIVKWTSEEVSKACCISSLIVVLNAYYMNFTHILSINIGQHSARSGGHF